MDAMVEHVGPHGLTSLRCLRCGEALDLHQPGADLPERLIGACSSCCDGCGSWHILNSVVGREEIVIALLPPCESFLDAFTRADVVAVGQKTADESGLSVDRPVRSQD